MKSVLKTMVSKDFMMNYCESNFGDMNVMLKQTPKYLLCWKTRILFYLSIRTIRPLVLVQSYFSFQYNDAEIKKVRSKTSNKIYLHISGLWKYNFLLFYFILLTVFLFCKLLTSSILLNISFDILSLNVWFAELL